MGKIRCQKDQLRRSLILVALVCAQGFAIDASGGDRQVSTLSPNQFVVIEVDSPSASRLGSQYPGRLRRVQRAPATAALNNVTVLLPTSVSAAVATSTRVLQQSSGSEVAFATPPPQCSVGSSEKAPTDSFILVCTDGSNQVSERDQRAIRAFVQFAAQESQPLAAHVSSEREWKALEHVLVARAAEGSSRPIPFREVRYGDGLTPGQIKIERLGAN
jgi:hypothetical protein